MFLSSFLELLIVKIRIAIPSSYRVQLKKLRKKYTYSKV